MKRNLGRIGRLVAGVIGIMILGLYGALEPPWQYFTLLGLVPLGTALTGFCPAFALLGWNRCGPAGPEGTS